MADAIEPKKTATHESCSSRIAALGIDRIKTTRGEVDVMEVAGLTTLKVQHGTAESVSILLYDPERQIGMLHQMSPDAARGVGASLLRLANALDPRPVS